MKLKSIFQQLDIISQCRKYGAPLHECPQFLFLIMGFLIIITILASYSLANQYIVDPLLVNFIISFLTAFLLVLLFIISKSFEKLAEANRMKTEFIMIISHQLRTPLTNISWSIDALTPELKKEETSEYLEIIQENIDKMKELVNNLLIVSKIEQKSLAVLKEKISLVELLKKIIANFKPYIKAYNANLTFQADENLPFILTDASQLKLVIENLIENAIRYIKKNGKIKIKISKNKNWLVLEISDNGIGIPKEDQKYIFKKFFRAKNARKFQVKGSGLGLYIARSITKRLGGKIWFKSKEGKGTSFWLKLPI